MGIFTEYDNQLTYYRWYLQPGEIILRLLSVSHAYSNHLTIRFLMKKIISKHPRFENNFTTKLEIAPKEDPNLELWR